MSSLPFSLYIFNVFFAQKEPACQGTRWGLQCFAKGRETRERFANPICTKPFQWVLDGAQTNIPLAFTVRLQQQVPTY